MDRREFLISSSGAVALATGTAAAEPGPVAAPAVGSGVRELKLAFAWPDNDRGFADSARRLAQRIEVLSERRFRVTVVAGEEAKAAELRHGTANDHLPHHRAFAYFAGLPGAAGLGALDFEAWLGLGGGQQLWDDLGEAAGVKSLLAGHSGRAPALWTRHPVAGIGDLQGRRVAVAGLAEDVVRGLGAEPVALPPAEIATGLARETVAGAEWGGAMQSMAAGVHEGARFGLGEGITSEGTALALDVDVAVWRALSEADRALLAAAAAAEFRLSLAESRLHEPIARRVLADRHGLTFAALPEDVADAIARISDTVVAHLAGADARATRINASYMAFRSACGDSGYRSAPVA